MTTPLDDEVARRARASLEWMLAQVPESDPACMGRALSDTPPPPAETLGDYLSQLRLEAGAAD